MDNSLAGEHHSTTEHEVDKPRKLARHHQYRHMAKNDAAAVDKAVRPRHYTSNIIRVGVMFKVFKICQDPAGNPEYNIEPKC